MERFESVIENVSSMEVKGYEDPVECTRNLEILAKSGEDQYLYKFTGPGVILPEIYQKKMLNDCFKLETENAKLKMKNKGISDDNALLLETNKKLKQENDKLENELGKWKRGVADCLMTRDEVRREKNKEINELKQQLQQAEIDKRRLTYKLEEKSNLPETPITDTMLVNDYKRLIKENEKLKKELSLEKAANEAQRKFIRMYAYAGKEAEVEFNYAIDEVGEVSYVIVEKEKYESLKDRSCMAIVHGKRYNTVQIVDMIYGLEKSNKNLTDKVKKLEEQKTMVIPGKMVDRISELEGLNEQLNERIKELEDLKTPTIEYFEEPSSRRDILKAAEKCVCGQREQDYGTPESNFQLIADLWNGYLGFMDHPRDQIRATDVAMMMALMKIARIRNGGGSGDSFVDLAGYAACGGEIWYGRKKQVPKGE